MRSRVRRESTIAAVLIVRDEARCIVRCLESLKPHVDRIVLVDTGSTDGTPELAAACGAEVNYLEWPNDFSAARNHALDLADADWNLVIDADEWIVSGGDQLRRWCRKPPRIGMICIHSALKGQQANRPERRNWIPRLLPRGVRYEGRVHEQPASFLRHERVELHVGHDGYLEDQISRKHGRNRPLLLRELQDRPGDAYLLFQLGKESELAEEFLTASAHYAEAFDKVAPNASWRHALVLRHLYCLGRIGRFDSALAVAETEIPNSPDSPDFFFVVGKLAFGQAARDPVHALSEWLPLATSAWERCLEIGERPELEGSMQGCGSYLARRNLEAARTQIARHLAREELPRISPEPVRRLSFGHMPAAPMDAGEKWNHGIKSPHLPAFYACLDVPKGTECRSWPGTRHKRKPRRGGHLAGVYRPKPGSEPAA